MEMQKAAREALLDGLAAYERRHGWRGKLVNVAAEGVPVEKYVDADWDEEVDVGGYVHAVVTSVGAAGAQIKFGTHTASLSAADVVGWPAFKGKVKFDSLLKTGDIVYVKVLAMEAGGRAHVSLEQDSGVEGALVAIDNATGEIKAMVGGRDFNLSKFNRATQALRQVGSSFKPYVYTAAIDEGATPDETIVDSPTTFQTASGPYTPHNYDGKFEGTITLRRALGAVAKYSSAEAGG